MALTRQVLDMSSEGDSTMCLSNLFQNLIVLTAKAFFLYPDSISPEAIHVHCLSSWYCASFWREHLHLLYNSILGMGRLWLDVSWAFSSLGWENWIISAFLHIMFSSSLIIFDHPLHPPQFFNVVLELGGPKLDTVLQVPKRAAPQLSPHLPNKLFHCRRLSPTIWLSVRAQSTVFQGKEVSLTGV